MKFTLLLGLLGTLLGSLSVYLASPHQRLLAQPWPTQPARVAGLLLVLAGGAALLRAMQTLPALFTLITLLMLAFAAWPYLGALRQLYGRAA